METEKIKIFPPPNWDTNFVGTNYWSRSTVGSFGHDSSSAKFDFYHASNGTVQSITSATFTSSASGDLLKFSFAHAPRGTGTDSLFIESSTNNGETYTALDTLWGNTSGGELNTASATTSEFTPTSSQWNTTQYSLTSGINKFRFKVKSGNGNNLYIDSVCKIFGVEPVVDTVKVIPEGYYNLGTGMLNARDTIRAFLRDSIPPYVRIDSAFGVLDSVTFRVPVLFPNANTKKCYLRIIHRNSLETWSKPFQYTRGSYFTYNFTDSASKAYGNNMRLKGTKYCIYSGDINHDGFIDGSDFAIVDNGVFFFESGYVLSDLTGDEFADLEDYTIVDNNAYNFISVSRPP